MPVVAAPVAAAPSSPVQHDFHAALHHLFGFAEFRAHQLEAVTAAASGRDLLVVMPTGAGKSLCFQLPAALSTGVTLVVSPLVALMRDQVAALRGRTEFRRLGCAYLNSLQSSDEQHEVLDLLRDGHLKLLYVAPERFRSGGFMAALARTEIARFVVDEAHCISQWGHDFRPDYLSLKSVVETLGRPPLLAVTATATVRVQQSIIENLGMRDPVKLVGGFNRANLHFSVHRCKSETSRQQLLARALPKLATMGGSGLIYAATRKGCEEVAALAQQALLPFGKSAAAYHAGLDSTSRISLQNRWLSGELQVLVATNAFGMGIDKADVRFVVHYVFPESIESYYQEAGRAGRDGRKSRCVVLYNFADRRTREWFIDNDELTQDDVRDAHGAIIQRAVDGVAQMSRLWWQNALGWNELKSRLAVGELERAGLVERLGEANDETTIKIIKRDFARAAADKVARDLGQRRAERLRRLDEMVSYCKTPACRRRTTLEYFGDLEPLPEAEPGEKIFCCDNCEKPVGAPIPLGNQPRAERAPIPLGNQPRAERTPMPAEIDNTDIHSILQGLDALWPQVGKARLNKILRGAASKDVQRFRDEDCPLLGILRPAPSARVDGFLDELITQGLLHQADEDEYFVCRVTRAGRECWQNRSDVEITIPGVTQKSPASGGAEDELFDLLSQWRRRQASDEQVPLYCILPNRTLLAVAHEKPRDNAALRELPGIGDVKLKKYGAAVLELVNGR